MRSRILLGLMLLAAPAVAAAQTDGTPTRVDASRLTGDRWQITTRDGSILWDLRVLGLDGDRLRIRLNDSLTTVAVGEIDEIRLFKKSTLSLGTGGGGGMAALMGGDDEIYDLRPLEFGDRLRTVQKLLTYHPPAAAAPPKP